jgi:hypothetical protein
MSADETQAHSKAPSVGKAWAWMVVLTGAMVLIGFLAWDSLSAAPSWFHALFGFQVLWAIAGVIAAYKRRSEWEASQKPV